MKIPLKPSHKPIKQQTVVFLISQYQVTVSMTSLENSPMAYIPHDLDLEEGLEVKCKDRLLLFSVFVLVWFPPAEKISMNKF